MESIKLAMILLVGQCAFNPLSALSEPLVENTEITVQIGGHQINCYAAERAGNYFKNSINRACPNAGYESEGGDFIDPRVGNKVLAESARSSIKACNLMNNISREIVVLNWKIKQRCAALGIEIKNKEDAY